MSFESTEEYSTPVPEVENPVQVVVEEIISKIRDFYSGNIAKRPLIITEGERKVGPLTVIKSNETVRLVVDTQIAWGISSSTDTLNVRRKSEITIDAEINKVYMVEYKGLGDTNSFIIMKGNILSGIKHVLISVPRGFQLPDSYSKLNQQQRNQLVAILFVRIHKFFET